MDSAGSVEGVVGPLFHPQNCIEGLEDWLADEEESSEGFNRITKTGVVLKGKTAPRFYVPFDCPGQIRFEFEHYTDGHRGKVLSCFQVWPSEEEKNFVMSNGFLVAVNCPKMRTGSKFVRSEPCDEVIASAVVATYRNRVPVATFEYRTYRQMSVIERWWTIPCKGAGEFRIAVRLLKLEDVEVIPPRKSLVVPVEESDLRSEVPCCIEIAPVLNEQERQPRGNVTDDCYHDRKRAKIAARSDEKKEMTPSEHKSERSLRGRRIIIDLEQARESSLVSPGRIDATITAMESTRGRAATYSVEGTNGSGVRQVVATRLSWSSLEKYWRSQRIDVSSKSHIPNPRRMSDIPKTFSVPQSSKQAWAALGEGENGFYRRWTFQCSLQDVSSQTNVRNQWETLGELIQRGVPKDLCVLLAIAFVNAEDVQSASLHGIHREGSLAYSAVLKNGLIRLEQPEENTYHNIAMSKFGCGRFVILKLVGEDKVASARSEARLKSVFESGWDVAGRKFVAVGTSPGQILLFAESCPFTRDMDPITASKFQDWAIDVSSCPSMGEVYAACGRSFRRGFCVSLGDIVVQRIDGEMVELPSRPNSDGNRSRCGVLSAGAIESIAHRSKKRFEGLRRATMVMMTVMCDQGVYNGFFYLDPNLRGNIILVHNDMKLRNKPQGPLWSPSDCCVEVHNNELAPSDSCAKVSWPFIAALEVKSSINCSELVEDIVLESIAALERLSEGRMDSCSAWSKLGWVDTIAFRGFRRSGFRDLVELERVGFSCQEPAVLELIQRIGTEVKSHFLKGSFPLPNSGVYTALLAPMSAGIRPGECSMVLPHSCAAGKVLTFPTDGLYPDQLREWTVVKSRVAVPEGCILFGDYSERLSVANEVIQCVVVWHKDIVDKFHAHNETKRDAHLDGHAKPTPLKTREDVVANTMWVNKALEELTYSILADIDIFGIQREYHQQLVSDFAVATFKGLKCTTRQARLVPEYVASVITIREDPTRVYHSPSCRTSIMARVRDLCDESPSFSLRRSRMHPDDFLMSFNAIIQDQTNTVDQCCRLIHSRLTTHMYSALFTAMKMMVHSRKGAGKVVTVAAIYKQAHEQKSSGAVRALWEQFFDLLLPIKMLDAKS